MRSQRIHIKIFGIDETLLLFHDTQNNNDNNKVRVAALLLKTKFEYADALNSDTMLFK